MFLKTLSLRQFRGYSHQDIDFSPRLNVFVGPNGSGKSNLMEAVSLLTTGQSHRGADPRHCVQWDKDAFALVGTFEGEEAVSVEVRHKKSRPRQVLVNNVVQKRIKDWVGRIPLVSFSPEDLGLVKGDPAGRRRLLNSVLSQVDGRYLETLQRYNKVQAERNAALRQVQEGEEQASVLEPWDAALLKEGASLTLRRYEFLGEFEPSVRRQHAALSSQREQIRMTYKPSFHLDEAMDLDAVTTLNRRRLADLREGEIALGVSLIGPHRDDVDILLGDAPARAYGSQGQQRTLALAVKLAEADFLLNRRGRQPIFLFDDMLSELDAERRGKVVASLISESQCLVSLATLSDWPPAGESPSRHPSRFFDVGGGVSERRLSA